MKKYLLLSFLLLTACQLHKLEPYEWAGKWTGPEGTYLEITQRDVVDNTPAAYDIAIRDLDKERHYTGSAQGDVIVFTRNGVSETIRQGTGDQTGMKWLAGKDRCLIIKSGEGYCRY